MNKKNRLYILILIVLVAVFLISRLDTKKEKRINFFSADSLNLARLELTTIDDTLHLENQSGTWKIVSPVNWDLQVNKIEKIQESVLTAQTSSIPVSENKASLEKYNLTDSLATHMITINQDGEVMDDVLIGKSSNYNVTPVRKIDSNQVFLLESNIGYMVKPTLNSWRKREILEIDPEQITKFMVVSHEYSYTLTQSDSLWKYADDREEFVVADDNKTLSDLKATFNRFSASDFVDGEYDKYAQALETPALELAIEMWSGQSYYFRFTEYEEKKYLLQLNNETDALYVVYESIMKKFQKQKEDFQ